MRKVNLFRLTSNNKEVSRKFYVVRTDLIQTIDAKRNSYEQIQKTFNRQKFLFDFDSIKIFYVDINSSKIYDFEAMLYHITISYKNSIMTNRIDVQSILFLSKMLTNVEKQY